MTDRHPLPVRYVLYTHFPEGTDFEAFLEQKKHLSDHGNWKHEVSGLDGVRSLVSHLEGLRGLLTWPGYEGLLVLFYAPGLAECLDGIADRRSEPYLRKNCLKLRFAKTVD